MIRPTLSVGSDVVPNPASSPADRVPWPRYATALLGAWLFLSAFLWQHSISSRTNSWLVGVSVLLTAIVAAAEPSLRRFNRALAVWLLICSVSLLDHLRTATQVNNAVIAVLVFALSFVPS